MEEINPIIKAEEVKAGQFSSINFADLQEDEKDLLVQYLTILNEIYEQNKEEYDSNKSNFGNTNNSSETK